MPFVKYIKNKKPCLSPEHNPPNMIVLEPGTHTWKCPACGKETKFTVNGVYL